MRAYTLSEIDALREAVTWHERIGLYRPTVEQEQYLLLVGGEAGAGAISNHKARGSCRVSQSSRVRKQ